MTIDELRTNLWATRVAQLTADVVALTVDLNLAQQRIKALEEAAKTPPKPADVVPIRKEGSNETSLRTD